jgi:hypothetical protein
MDQLRLIHLQPPPQLCYVMLNLGFDFGSLRNFVADMNVHANLGVTIPLVLPGKYEGFYSCKSRSALQS